MRHRQAIAALLSLSIFPGIAGADEVLLTVSGKLKGDRDVHLTLADLTAMGSSVIRTATPWHEGTVTFEGVSLERLMEEVGADGEFAFVLALNEYSTEIPLSDFGRFGTILAYKENGRYMDVASKGPLFIVYPYDDVPELRSELYYSRSAWQVVSIEIE